MTERNWNEIFNEFEEVMTQESINAFCNRKDISIDDFKPRYEKYVKDHPCVECTPIKVNNDEIQATINFSAMLDKRSKQNDKFLETGIKLVCNGVEIYLAEGYNHQLFRSIIKRLKTL